MVDATLIALCILHEQVVKRPDLIVQLNQMNACHQKELAGYEAKLVRFRYFQFIATYLPHLSDEQGKLVSSVFEMLGYNIKKNRIFGVLSVEALDTHL